jgi:hypothetical protein
MTNLESFMENQTESLRKQITDAHETAKNLANMARNVEDRLAAGALCRCYGQVLASLAKALEMVP